MSASTVFVAAVCLLTLLVFGASHGPGQSFPEHGTAYTAVKFENGDVIPGGKESKLPDILTVSFDVSGSVVRLRLFRMPHLDSAPVFVLAEDGETVQQFEKEDAFNQIHGHYQCYSHSGSFIVTYHTDIHIYTLEGTFFHGGQDYHISSEHIAEAPDDTTKRSKSDYSSPEHTIKKVFPNPEFRSEYGIKSSGAKPKQLKGQIREKRQTGSSTLYEVETLVVIDYAAYAFWYVRTPGTGEQRRQDTMANIEKYYAYLMNSVDMRYQNIDESDMVFRILYNGILVMTTTAQSSWTEINKIPQDGGFVVDAQAALRSFTNWLKTANVPAHDHAMLITGYPFTTPGLAGFSFVDGICTDESTSISFNEFDFQGFLTAAHELGHNLGAIHDEVTTGCSSLQRYIMAGSYNSSFSADNIQRPWQFSPCSVESFRRRINEMNGLGTNCLLNRIGKPAASIPDPVPGQYYDVDQICRYTFGTYMCRSLYEIGNISSICGGILCLQPTGGACSSVVAPYGISCGNKAWCRQGYCVSSTEAPEIDDLCPFGDSPGTINGKSCSEHAQEPYKCYGEEFRKLCCESCGPNIGFCPYGDQHPDCGDVQPYQCYNNNTASQCCETCPGWWRNRTDCEYGDKIRRSVCESLHRSACYNNNDTCCETCVPGPNPNCTFGDRTHECPLRIKKEKALCYNSHNFDLCCESCPANVYGHEGCEWGDKISNCSTLPLYVCHDPVFKDLCCEMCNDTGAPCQFGDANPNCTTIEPRDCYKNNNTCCKTCPKLADDSFPGCEWGDRARNCSLLTAQNAKADCYNETVNLTCCKTCADLSEPWPGCEYGDRDIGCTKQKCFDSDYRYRCCSTCRGYVPTTSTTTSATTTTTLAMATTTTLSTTTTMATKTSSSTTIRTTAKTTPSTTQKPTIRTTVLPTKPPKTTIRTTVKTTPSTTQKPTIRTTVLPTKPPKTTIRTTVLTTPSTTQKPTIRTTVLPTKPPKTTIRTTVKTTPSTTQKSTIRTTVLPTKPPKTTIRTTVKTTPSTTQKPTIRTAIQPTQPPKTTKAATNRQRTSTELQPTDKIDTSTGQSKDPTADTGTTDSSPPAAGPSSGLSTEHYVGIAGGALAFILLVILLVCCLCRRKKTTRYDDKVHKPLDAPMIVLSPSEVPLASGKKDLNLMKYTPKRSPYSQPRNKDNRRSPKSSPKPSPKSSRKPSPKSSPHSSPQLRHGRYQNGHQGTPRPDYGNNLFSGVNHLTVDMNGIND